MATDSWPNKGRGVVFSSCRFALIERQVTVRRYKARYPLDTLAHSRMFIGSISRTRSFTRSTRLGVDGGGALRTCTPEVATLPDRNVRIDCEEDWLHQSTALKLLSIDALGH